MNDKIETCCVCDEPTGHAGKADDSLFDNEGKGPYCDECFETLHLGHDTFTLACDLFERSPTPMNAARLLLARSNHPWMYKWPGNEFYAAAVALVVKDYIAMKERQ